MMDDHQRSEIAYAQEPGSRLTELPSSSVNALIDYGVLGVFVAVTLWILGGWVRSQLQQNAEITDKFISYLQEDKARMEARDHQWSEAIHELSRSVQAMKDTLEWLKSAIREKEDR